MTSSRPLTSPAAPLLALLMAGCGVETSSNTSPPPIPAEVDRLADWLSGSFDSSRQAAGESSAFLDITLNACRIWPDRTDGRWVYVEQAKTESADDPYRQRIYRLRVDDQAELISEVFTFPSGSTPAGGSWRDPASLNAVDPFMLVPRDGCTVHLKLDVDVFSGGTRGTGCESSLNGAVYATSEVEITANRISSWDRGFDAEDRQTWGSEAGPYIFIRRPSD